MSRGVRPSFAEGYSPRDGPPAYPQLQQELECYWSAALGKQGATLEDVSVGHSSGVVSPRAAQYYVPGDPRSGGYAVDLIPAGPDDIVFPLNFTPVVPITLFARFKPKSVTGAHAILTVSNTKGAGFWAILVQNDGLRAQTTGDGGSNRSANLYNVLTANEWYTVVGVFESETTRTIYLDGSSQSATYVLNAGPVNGTDNIKSGLLSTQDNHYWRASIRLSSIGIWSRALVPSEIQLLHDRLNAPLELRRPPSLFEPPVVPATAGPDYTFPLDRQHYTYPPDQQHYAFPLDREHHVVTKG